MGCATVVHTDCSALVELCPTLGCRRPLRPDRAGEAARERVRAVVAPFLGAVSVPAMALLLWCWIRPSHPHSRPITEVVVTGIEWRNRCYERALVLRAVGRVRRVRIRPRIIPR